MIHLEHGNSVTETSQEVLEASCPKQLRACDQVVRLSQAPQLGRQAARLSRCAQLRCRCLVIRCCLYGLLHPALFQLSAPSGGGGGGTKLMLHFGVLYRIDNDEDDGLQGGGREG